MHVKELTLKSISPAVPVLMWPLHAKAFEPAVTEKVAIAVNGTRVAASTEAAGKWTNKSLIGGSLVAVLSSTPMEIIPLKLGSSQYKLPVQMQVTKPLVVQPSQGSVSQSNQERLSGRSRQTYSKRPRQLRY